MHRKTVKRFWNKVSIREIAECWPWIGSTDSKGYGVFSFGLTSNNMSSRKLSGAHRISYFLTHGVMPNVCRHSCDNPSCVNPAHLLNGTQRDNMIDMVAKGRNSNRPAVMQIETHKK